MRGPRRTRKRIVLIRPIRDRDGHGCRATSNTGWKPPGSAQHGARGDYATSVRYTAQMAPGFVQVSGEPRRIDPVGRHHGADERIGQRLVEGELATVGVDQLPTSTPHHASPG